MAQENDGSNVRVEGETTGSQAVPETPETSGDASETAAQEQVPGKTFTQADIDEIVKKVKAKGYSRAAEAKREAEYWKNAALQGKEPAKAETPVEGEPKREAFADWEEYVSAKATWHAKREAQKLVDSQLSEVREARAREAIDAQEKSLDETWAKSVAVGKKKYADFTEVVGSDDVHITFAMGRAIRESEIGHEIAYHLAKHPEEAEKIAQMNTSAAIRAIGRLEERIDPAAKKPGASKSPEPPITPVSGTGTHGNELSDRLDNDTWMKNRNAQIAERARARAGR